MDCPSLHYTYNCSFSMAIMAMVMPMRQPENQACCKGSPSPRKKMRRRTRSLITLRSCWCCCLCVSNSYHCMAVLEYLDFERCKRWLRTKLGAMLRVMPYRPIRKAFERRCLVRHFAQQKGRLARMNRWTPARRPESWLTVAEERRLTRHMQNRKRLPALY